MKVNVNNFVIFIFYFILFIFSVCLFRVFEYVKFGIKLYINDNKKLDGTNYVNGKFEV